MQVTNSCSIRSRHAPIAQVQQAAIAQRRPAVCQREDLCGDPDRRAQRSVALVKILERHVQRQKDDDRRQAEADERDERDDVHGLVGGDVFEDGSSRYPLIAGRSGTPGCRCMSRTHPVTIVRSSKPNAEKMNVYIVRSFSPTK